jgi:hypothetical protein
MIEKIKNNFLGIITIFLLALLFLISPSFKFSKYNTASENFIDPDIKEITTQLDLINYKLLNKNYAYQEYKIPRLVFNAYPKKISFKNKLSCSVYEIEINTREINNIREKLIKIKVEQKHDFESNLKSNDLLSRSHYYIYLDSVPLLENGKINLNIANKYIDLCASENALAKIKEPSIEILGDLDYVIGLYMGNIYYPSRAYPVLISKGPVKSRLKIIVFDGLDWWYYVKFSR